jgi:DNA-binding MarR family transcriptional regulator
VSDPATHERDADDPLPSWSALVNVYQSVLHDVVAALDEQAGTDSGVFSALAYLERARPPHRLPMGELQRAMHPRYSQPGFSRLVQRMEADGLVERRRDPADRRATIVVSTRAGRAQFRAANAVYVAALRTSFGRHLSADDHARLAAMLSRVTAHRAGERSQVAAAGSVRKRTTKSTSAS